MGALSSAQTLGLSGGRARARSFLSSCCRLMLHPSKTKLSVPTRMIYGQDSESPHLLVRPPAGGVCSPVRHAITLLQFGAHPDPSTPTHVALCSWGDALATITQPLLAACFVCRVGSIEMQQNQGAALPTANLFPATTSSSKQEGREGVMLSAQTDPLHTPNLPRTQPHPPAARYPVPTAPCCSRLRFFQQSSSDGRETHSFAGAPRDARISCIRCSLVREGTREAPRQCLGLKGPPAGDVREGCGQTHTSSPLPPQRSLWSGSRHGANKSGTGQIMQERWMEGEGEKDGREEVC